MLQETFKKYFPLDRYTVVTLVQRQRDNRPRRKGAGLTGAYDQALGAPTDLG